MDSRQGQSVMEYASGLADNDFYVVDGVPGLAMMTQSDHALCSCYSVVTSANDRQPPALR
jgi:hypothetical protein